MLLAIAEWNFGRNIAFRLTLLCSFGLCQHIRIFFIHLYVSQILFYLEVYERDGHNKSQQNRIL